MQSLLLLIRMVQPFCVVSETVEGYKSQLIALQHLLEHMTTHTQLTKMMFPLTSPVKEAFAAITPSPDMAGIKALHCPISLALAP